ncbi:hypothetical protein [Nocardia rhizosphaerae]|uniref:Uncharacterized protein n=1 Tax=Nocardia rhizosphaerae TaxID=1691571 RepID=A0ABV8LDE8_9NOCA
MTTSDLVSAARAAAFVSPDPRLRNLLTVLADRIDSLRGERDQYAETARQATNHAVDQASTITFIRHALGQHPRCDVHPDDDEPITCGWMRAVASVQWALDQATQTTTEEDGDE